MKIKTLEDLLTDELKDLYSAETQITKALPKMAKTTQSHELRTAFEEHLKQTENQVKRLEKACDELGISPKGKKCVGMEGLLEEGKEIMTNGADPNAMEAGLIGAAQKVEHYEIAGYGCVHTYAHQLGEQQDARLLRQTLDEEGATDKQLTQLAEQVINLEAVR